VVLLPAARNKFASRIVAISMREQGLQRGAQCLIVGAFRRQQQDRRRAVGVPDIVQHHQIVSAIRPSLYSPRLRDLAGGDRGVMKSGCICRCARNDSP